MQAGCRHFEVISPEIVEYSFYEPPEPFRCWVIVEADTRRDALVKAIAKDEFSRWTAEARSDSINPFKGVVASRPWCDHGNCWACADCITCLTEFDEEAKNLGPFV